MLKIIIKALDIKIQVAIMENYIKINIPLLTDHMRLQAKINNKIIYDKQVDKSTIKLFTQNYDGKYKYSKLSKQVFNDLNILAQIKPKRNNKKANIGSSNIILNDKDLNDRNASKKQYIRKKLQ